MIWLFLNSILFICHILITIYTWIVIIACVLSFVNPDPYNKLVIAIYRLTAPAFNLVRRVLPMSFGGFDFSPIVIILSLQFLDSFVLWSMR